VANDPEQVAVEVPVAEACAPGEPLGVTLQDNRVQTPVFRPELSGHEHRPVALTLGRPVALGPLTDRELEPELHATTTAPPWA